MHLKTIFRILGSLLLLLAAVMLGCSVVSIIYGEHDFFAFVASALIVTLAGLWLQYFGKGAHNKYSRRDGYVTIAASWIAFALVGSLPYLLSGSVDGSFTNAFFESMSGFSTTGATILQDIESQPHALLLWRSFSQWLGGLGIVFFTVAVLPMFGFSGVQLFAAEATGATKQKAHPRVAVSARWILAVYVTLTVLCSMALAACGMGGFESVCHGLTTIATGGFSTRQMSIESFHSPTIEYVITFFMFVAGINYTLLYLFVLKGKIRKLFSNTEFRCYLGLVLCFTLIVTIGLLITGDPSVPEGAGWMTKAETSFRHAIFQVVALQTTTGYTTTDYMLWAPFLWMIMSFVMYFGACGGSSSGAMKCSRLAIFAKSIHGEFLHILHPNAVLPVRIDKQVISPSTRMTVLTFVCLYILLVFVSWLIFMMMGIGFTDAYGMAVGSIGNIGPALGNVGPSFTWFEVPVAAKWFSAALMLVGRLELFSVLLMFSPEFWKTNAY